MRNDILVEPVNMNNHPRDSVTVKGGAIALEEDLAHPRMAEQYLWEPTARSILSCNCRARFPVAADNRPRVQGKFIFAGGEKLYVRGVTYGTFRPNEQGEEFPAPEVVERDFALMAANGVNAVRTYTPPPLWLMDAAHRHGLRIMAGLPVERSVAFLDYRKCARALVMAEMGLDSLRHGEATQAQVLGWQVRTSFAAGCAGVFVYAWTDEWFRGGAEVEDWMFGITARNRALKPALTAVREAFNEV